MSQLSKAAPVAGERIAILQPATLDSLEAVCAVRTDFTRQLRDALKGGALVLDRNAVVVREYSPGVDAVLFVVGAGLVVGRLRDSAEVAKAHADAHDKGRIVRPGLYR